MAAAEVLVFTQSFIGSENGWATSSRSTTAWDEHCLRAQLSLIARAWNVERRNDQVGTSLICFGSGAWPFWFCPR